MYVHVTIELKYAAIAEFVPPMTRVAEIMTGAGWQLREALAQNSGRLFTVRHVWKIKDLSHYQAGVDALVQHADFPALAEQLAKVVETETIHFASAMPYAPAE